MAKYTIEESDQFLANLEEAVVWILLTNIEQSESLALKKVDDLSSDLNALKMRLQDHPESGENDEIKGIRRFPVYEGRYSAKWVVNHSTRTVTLISLADSKYPKQLRQYQFDE